MGFQPERIGAASKTHREDTNVQTKFTQRRNGLYAKARLAMGNPES